MSSKTPRFIIETEGVNHDAVQLGFKAAFQLCAQNNVPLVTLVVPTKQGFPSTIVAQPIGPTASKALAKGEKVKISGNIFLSLESSKTFQDYQFQD